MKKLLNAFFVTLGVVFFVIILSGIYFYIADPFNLKPLLYGDESIVIATTTNEKIDTHLPLNESQVKALETFGIDPANIPRQITSMQEACFEEKLGKERVTEIKAGDSPTPAEYLKARDCI
jgi:hypothetical protein